MTDPVVKITRATGWTLFVAGVLVGVGTFVYHLLADTDMPAHIRFMLMGIYGGLAVLLFSVLRQRLLERNSDKYNDVEI